jgi:hypothetical protein
MSNNDAIFSNLIMLIMFLVVVSAGGLIAGIIYFDMQVLDINLRTINFTLPIQEIGQANSNLTDFQDVLGTVVYPILGLRDSLPYLTYFMVFAFIIALGMSAYLTSKNPIFFVLHILFTVLITYFCIILSNTYKDLLSQPFINSMMINFTIYNKLMLYLPQVVFFTSLLFGVISFVNIMKPQTNYSNVGLNYGGDY